MKQKKWFKMEKSILKVKNLTVRFEKEEVIKNLSFEVKKENFSLF
jgi:ABC-type Mn2+/Zn2+ transport system ATPase subunit